MAPSGQVGTAFFHFDTDVEQVYRRMSSGIGQIESLIARAESATNANAGAFRAGDFERGITGQLNGLRSLSRELEAGRITAAQFQESFRGLATGGFQTIRTDLGRALTLSPESLRNSLPIVDIFRQQGALAVDALYGELAQIRKRSPEVAQALRGLTFRKSDVASELSGTPYAIPDDRASQVAENARLQRLASRIAARRVQDPFDEEGGRIVRPEDEALLERLGLTQRFNRDPILSSILNTGQKPPGVGADYLDRERDFRAEERSAAGTAKLVESQRVEMERSAAAAREFARFMSDPQMVRAGNYLFSPQTGIYGRLDERLGGVTTQLNDAQAYKAQQAVEAQVRRDQQQAEGEQRRRDREGRVADRARQPFTQSFLDGFTSRGFGAREGALNLREFATNELSTFGTVARYTALYQVLGLIQHGFSDTVSEVLDFRDSLTDVNVAMGESGPATGALVGNLQAISRLAGENTGAALDSAARGIRTFGDEAVAAGGSVDEAGVDIARASARIALIANKDLRDATGDVIAIASAFNLAAGQANQVVDAISAAKDFGGDPKQIAQGLANFATTANEAGFTLGESANALSLVIARTDQTGQAAATRLSRITSILAGTTGRSVIEELNGQGANIDPEATVKDQLVAIASAYQKAAPELQGRIRSALGGTSNLRELIPLLEPGQLVNGDGSLGRIFTEAGEQAGRGVQEFNRKTNDLVGTLKKLQGDISAIQVNLFRVGIFDGIGVALRAIEPGLNVLARLLDLIDRLTGSIPGLQTVLGTLLDIQVGLSIANKIKPGIVASNVLGLVAPRVGGAATAATAGSAAAGYVAASNAVKAEVALATSATRSATALNYLTGAVERNAAAQAAGSLGGGSRLTGLLGTLKGAGPLLIAAAGIASLDFAFQTGDKLGAIDTLGRKNNRALLSTDTEDPASIAASIKSLEANRAELREAQKGFSLTRPLDSLSSLFVKGNRDKAIEQSHIDEEYLKDLARRVNADRNLAAQSRQVSVFGEDAAHNLEQVAIGLSKLKTAGAGAVEQFSLLAKSLLEGDVTSAGTQALPTDNPSLFSDRLAQALFAAIPGAAKGLSFTRDIGEDPYNPGGRLTEDLTPRQFAGFIPSNSQNITATGDQVQALLQSYNLKPGEVLTEEQAQALADVAAQSLGLDGLGGDVQEFQSRLVDLLYNRTRDSLTDLAQRPVDRKLSADAADKLLNGDGDNAGIKAARDAALGNLASNDTDGRLSVLRQYRNILRNYSKANPNLGLLAEETQLAESEFSEAAVDRLEQLRRAAQAAAAGDKGKIRRIGIRSFNKEVNTALASRNLALIVDIFERASQFEIDLVRQRVAQALAAANAQLASIEETYTGVGGVGANLRGAEQAAESSGAAAAAAQARRNKDLVDNAAGRANASGDKGDSTYLTGSDAAGVGGGGGSDLTAAQKRARAAGATLAPDDAVAQARNAVAQANADLAAADKGSEEYYSALEQVTQARFNLAQALAGRRSAKAGARAAQRGGDVAQARAALVQARANLDVATEGTAAYYEALGSYYEAQRRLREALITARFTRRRANSDVTDSVRQAAIDLRESQAKLAADRRTGAGPEVLNQDRIDVKDKQARLESEAFSRRLHDIQTAEQLGSVSHVAYISYLQKEHDRLSAIKNRTRQQTEQLQEIDLAMKQATEQFSGQFNLGEIKVPTPFEARRALEAARGGTSFTGEAGNVGAAQTSVVNNFKIDGTDIVAVKKVITDVLGPLATSRSSSASRKA